MNHPPTKRRLIDLLVDHATEGLDPREAGELQSLLPTCSLVDADTIELAAAAVDVALMADQLEPMPPRLRERLINNYSFNTSTQE